VKYELFFDDRKLGTVVGVGSDFPHLWGHVEYDASLKRPHVGTYERLLNFIAVNCESMRLVDVMHEQDVSDELNAVNSKLEAYADFIESDKWRLVDANGNGLPILCPIFRDGGAIEWRWNPRR
jgi:hypothetical protein